MYFALFYITALLLSGCVGLRSEKGLDQGELNISYYAPLAGAVRYGVTDNIEVKGMLVFEVYYLDLFLHTNRDSGQVNYGLTLGTYYNYDYGYKNYIGATFSKKMSNSSR